MKEMEAKKRVLEEAVDAVNEEMSKVRAEGKLTVMVEPCLNILAPPTLHPNKVENIRKSFVSRFAWEKF